MDDENNDDDDGISSLASTRAPLQRLQPSHPHWIVLSTTCVDNPNDDDDNFYNGSHNDDEEWKNAWTYVIQNHPIYCDFLMDGNDYNSHNDNDDHRRTSSFLDSMQFYPNQRLHPCGRDNLLSSSRGLKTTTATTTTSTTAISIANCHYKIYKHKWRLEHLDNHEEGSNSIDGLHHFFQENKHTNATTSMTKTMTDAYWNLPLFPTPEYFATTPSFRQANQQKQPLQSQNALLATNTILIHFDTTHAKQVLHQEWCNMKYIDPTHMNETNAGSTRLHNESRPTKIPPLPETNLYESTCCSSSFPVGSFSSKTLHGKQPPRRQQRQQQHPHLIYATTTRQKQMDELLLRTMETMLRREMQDMNAVLIILAFSAMILTAALGWTARQILYPSASGRNNSNKSGGALQMMKEIPSTIIGPKNQPPTDDTISPLSMDPVLTAKTTTMHPSSMTSSPLKRNNLGCDTAHPVAVTPCTKLEEQWWNNRVIRRHAIRKKTSIQPPIVPITIANHHKVSLSSPPLGVKKEVENDDDEDVRPRFVLRTTVTPPPTTPCRTPPTPQTGPRTPPSSFFQELQSKAAVQQPPPVVSWTTTTRTVSSPTQPSLVEDYW
jgi:hypothetical protein